MAARRVLAWSRTALDSSTEQIVNQSISAVLLVVDGYSGVSIFVGEIFMHMWSSTFFYRCVKCAIHLQDVSNGELLCGFHIDEEVWVPYTVERCGCIDLICFATFYTPSQPLPSTEEQPSRRKSNRSAMVNMLYDQQKQSMVTNEVVRQQAGGCWATSLCRFAVHDVIDLAGILYRITSSTYATFY